MTEIFTDKQKIQAWIMAGETQTKAAQLSKYNHQKFRWQNLVPPLIAVEIELKKDKERKIAAATSTFLFLDSQLHQCIRALRISEYDIMADIAKVNTLSLDYTEYDAFVINAMAACTEYMRVCIEFGATETRYTMIELISNDAWYQLPND
jgi:hypothetical protein